MNLLFWGAVTRIAQALLHAAPTIVVGILVAAFFQRVLGRASTFRLFGGRTWRQLPQAWLMGMLLPVCSLGAIPIMSELRKAGLVGGTILAFGLTAPIFNPVSVLYGLSLSHPSVMMTICLCSLVLVTILGVLWDKFFPVEYIEPESAPEVPYGIRRIASVGLAMLRIGSSRDMGWMVVGTLGIGLLSALLPANSLQTSAENHDWFAPLRMAMIALPAYVTPMDAMVQLSTMFQHGNSIAAAFTLLILGTGLNLGMIGWIGFTYSWKKALAWVGMAVVLVVGLGFLIGRPLYPQGVTPVGHTHAFDQFCCPLSQSSDSPIQVAQEIILDGTQAYEGISLAIFVVILCGGWIVAWVDPNRKFEERLFSNVVDQTSTEAGNLRNATSRDPRSQFLMRDLVLPNSVVSVLAFLALMIGSVVGCFIYYPSQEVMFKELSMSNAETCTRATSGDWKGVMLWIPVYEDQLRKLQVGMYLRGQSLSQQQAMLLEKLESDIEALEHAVGDSDREEILRCEKEVRMSYFKFRKMMAYDTNNANSASVAPAFWESRVTDQSTLIAFSDEKIAHRRATLSTPANQKR